MWCSAVQCRANLSENLRIRWFLKACIEIKAGKARGWTRQWLRLGMAIV